ncbi:MAG: type IV pilus assembly protein PilM [Phycisphaerales bacterium]|jgi:type IV pilus assembly protein PilM|nr:type IV pilus assembly protein PilM [Phycisphaerales bacterium]
MAHPSTAWGIDIGQFAIKAIRLEREGSTVQVTDYEVVQHQRVLSSPDTDAAEVTRLSLGQLISKKNLEGEHLVISVPGHSAFARFAKLPPVEPKAVPDIVKFEAVQQIPFPIEEVEWDYAAFHDEGSPEVEVGIFAITRERVNTQLDVYDAVGLSPEALTLSPTAVYNAMHYDFELTNDDAEQLVIVDIGTQATDVIIASGKRCWIRTFPLGGTHFTEAIAEAFKISYAKAERLKLEAASSKYAKQIMQAMRPVFADLLQELQRSLSYASGGVDLNDIVGVGSTFRIPGLRKFIGQQLQVNVARLDEFKRIDVKGREASAFAENCVNMSTAYGLALQGIGLGHIDVNLVPTTILREQLWHQKTKWFVAAACIMILGSAVTLLGPFLDSQALGTGGVPSKVRNLIDKGTGLQKEFKKAEQDGKLGTDAAGLVALLEYRDVWPYIVHDAAESLAAAGPENRVMTLEDFLAAFPAVEDRPLVQLRKLEGQLVQSDADQPRIAVQMQVELNHANPVTFLDSHVAAWLRSNAEPTGDRVKVPYKIIRSTVSCNPEDMETIVVDPEVVEDESSDSSSSENSGGGNNNSGGGGGTKMGGGGGSGPSPSGGSNRGGSGRGSGSSRKPPKKPSKPTEQMFPSVEITESTFTTSAPLPEYPEKDLHPPDSEWYKATVTFEVELVPQPRPEETALLDEDKAGTS